MMEIRDIKEYYLLYTLLGTTEHSPISSTTLSDMLSLSNKSVQSNISALNDYCKRHGFEITSKSGTGFFCRVLEPGKVSAFQRQLTVYFSKNHLTYGNEAMERGQFILYLADRGQPITVFKLCEKFYFSKSKVYSFFEGSKKFLSGAGLTLVNERGRGLVVEGPEFIRRNFVAFCLSNPIFQNDIASIFRYDFHFIGKNPAPIPRVLQIMRSHGIALDDEKLNAFLLYLTYAQYRYQRHCLLEEWTEDELAPLTQCPEYTCARQLAQLFSLSYSHDERELAGVTAFLLANDCALQDVSEAHYGPVYYQGITDLYNYLDKYLCSLSPQFRNVPIYEKTLKQLCAHLFFLYEFGTADCSFANIEYNLYITSNAMVRYLARLLTEKTMQYFGESIKFTQAVCLCNFAQNLLYCAHEEKSDIRLLLVLKEGCAFSDYITGWMRAHLKPEPAQIDFMSLTEAENANLAPYDMILSDYNYLDHVQENYPVYQLSDPLDHDTSFVNEYYRISNNRSISLERIVHYFSNTIVKRNCAIETTNDFLEALDNDLDGLGNIPFRTVRRRGVPINYYSGNNILVVPHLEKSNDKEPRENILAIYFNDKKLHLKYDVMVFFSAGSTFEPDALLRLTNLCNEFCVHPDVFERLAEYLSSK